MRAKNWQDMKTPEPKLLYLDLPVVSWPIATDKLFQESADWRHNAFLNLGGKSWESYASGYKQAADFLAQRFLENYQGMDTLIYPIVFLYRHYIELRLKQLIIAGQKLLEQPINYKDIHDLVILWRPCREILQKIWPEEPVATWDNVEKLIKEFNQKDTEGMNFRYPITTKKKGRKPTLPALDHVGIGNLYEVMQRLACFFECHIEGLEFEDYP